MEKHQAAGCHPGVSISLSSLSGMRGRCLVAAYFSKDDVTRQGFTSPELPLPRLQPEVSFKEDFFFLFQDFLSQAGSFFSSPKSLLCLRQDLFIHLNKQTCIERLLHAEPFV